MHLFIAVFQLALLIIIYLLAYLHGHRKGFNEAFNVYDKAIKAEIEKDEFDTLKKPVDKPFTRG